MVAKGKQDTGNFFSRLYPAWFESLPCSCHDIAMPWSFDESGRKKALDAVTGVTYAQLQGKKGIFINVTTVLSSSGLLNDPPGSLQVVGALWRDRIPGYAPRNWQQRGIIPVNEHGASVQGSREIR
jgi:hypothetical protein